MSGSSGALVVHQPGSQWRQQLRQSMAADLEQLQVTVGGHTPCTGLELGAGCSHRKAAALRAVHARGFQQAMAGLLGNQIIMQHIPLTLEAQFTPTCHEWHAASFSKESAPTKVACCRAPLVQRPMPQ